MSAPGDACSGLSWTYDAWGNRTAQSVTSGTTKGEVFNNELGKLPIREAGYYRRYTVPLTGASGRGEARLVTGEAGEIYYTPDHYKTFVRIK